MLKDMRDKPYGTIMGKDRVIGYYKLHAAPWAIMLHARGSQILAPIIRFRLYYLMGGVLCLIVILALIRLEVEPVYHGHPAPSRPGPPRWPGGITASLCRWPAGMKSAD